MKKRDLTYDSLQTNTPCQSSSVDDLLRQKLANRLKTKKRRARSNSSDSSSPVGSAAGSSVGNFEDRDSDFLTDEKYEELKESSQEDNTSASQSSNKQDDDTNYLASVRSQKRQKLFNYLERKIQEKRNSQNHFVNISPDKRESTTEKNQLKENRNETYTSSNQTNAPSGNEKIRSFEHFQYLNEILNSYLLLPIAAEKLKECNIDVSFSIQSLCKGLCQQWTETGNCDNENCAYTHEPKILFEKKLASFSSLNITSLLLYTPNVQFDVEILITGFQELVKKEREIPDKWIERLIFYIFTKSKSVEPCFLEFWYIVAKYFCSQKGVNNLAYGFIMLLNIIFNVKEEDRWKVIKFLEIIQGPPSNLHLSYQLLKPILHFDIPSDFLIKVVNTCNEIQVDVIETYSEIVPKIPIDDLSLNDVEVLLRFSEILSSFHPNFSVDLKKKLESKISRFQGSVNKDEYPLTHYRLSKLVPPPENNNDYKSLMKDILKELEENFNVNFFGININKIKLNHVNKAIEEIMSVVFSLELTPQDAIDLITAAVLSSNSKPAETITATLANSLIYDYVTSQDWETAYSILTICFKKDICLPYAKIIKRDLEFLTGMSQARIAFLLSEIYINNQKYDEFIEFFERYNLLDTSCRAWSVDFNEGDNRFKAQLIENFFTSAFTEEATDSLHIFFYKIYRSQNEFYNPIDLRMYVSELIISLINQENEDLVIELKNTFCKTLMLKPIAVRSLLAFLVQKNRIEEAKEFFKYHSKTIYKIPSVIKTSEKSPFTLRIASVLSDEELHLLFEYFFLKMMKYKFSPSSFNKIKPEDCKFNIALDVVDLDHDSNVKPWYLMEVINTEKATTERIKNLLENKIVPPIQTFNLSKLIFVDSQSVHKLLLDRFLNVKKL